MTTLAVDIRHTIQSKSVKDAAASAWAVGGKPVKPAYRIVAHDKGFWRGEFTSASGGRVQDKKRVFDDLVEAEKIYPDNMESLVGSGQASRVRRLS